MSTLKASSPARGQPPLQTTGSQEKVVYQARETGIIGEKAWTKDRLEASKADELSVGQEGCVQPTDVWVKLK